MSFAGGVFLIFCASGLLWIATNGVEIPSPMAGYETLIRLIGGKPPTESATVGTGPDDDERPVSDEVDTWSLS